MDYTAVGQIALIGLLAIILADSIRRRRPERPDPRQRRAWKAAKGTPRIWWGIR